MSASLPMAMGQGEQPTIHPFFRRDFGVPPDVVQDGIPRHELLDNGCAVGENKDGHDASNSLDYGRPSHYLTSSSSVLEHDPNSNRRKRRKTDNLNNTDVPEELPASNEASKRNEMPRRKISSLSNQSAITPNTLVELAESITSSESIISADKNSDTSTLRPSLKLNPVPETPISDGPPLPNETTRTEQVSGKRSPTRKTLRLNPNGKLLSSPVSKQSDEKSQKKKGSRRSKAAPQKLGHGEKKLVVFKYANDGEAREKLGKLIDDIINGQLRHGSSELPAPIPPPIARENQAPKPTHPFFIKKAVRKPDPSCHDSATTTPERDSRGTPLSDRKHTNMSLSGKSLTSFKPRPSKFPESIHPVWPPKEFRHVRGIEKSPSQEYSNCYSPLPADKRKAKTAAIQILDKESVLSSDVHARNQNILQTLRMPGRHVASGQVLQKAVTKQLSESSLVKDANTKVLSNACHPALARLHSTIPSSLSAFDRGGFDTYLWTQKYAPESAEEVLQTSREALMLRDWLKRLMVSSVDTGKSKDSEKVTQKTDDRKRGKRRKKSDKLDGFIVSSGDEDFEMSELAESDEDELAGGVTVSTKRTVIRSGNIGIISKSSAEKGRISNVILLSGPSGCGKTASVYAVAKELDFEVFEINPGNRRSARDIVDRVGDMTRNHLVHNVNSGEEISDRESPGINLETVGSDDSKQSKLVGLFKPLREKNSKTNKKPGVEDAKKETDPKRSRSQKQSLILLEEADLLFEDDKQFWSGVMSLISQSKRPIIITCNDENLLPLEDISFHAILRYRAPPQQLAVDYLLLLAANESHMLKREAVDDLYTAAGRDLRRAIMELNFWCQMAIGSDKSGLDWMLDRWPQGADIDQNGDPLRVLSLNTYLPLMGWFSRDILLENTLDSEIESKQESLHWWQLSLQDSETLAEQNQHGLFSSRTNSAPTMSNIEHLDMLRHQSDYADMRSVLDVLCSDCSLNPKLDTLDITAPPISDKQKANYIEGYPLLEADLVPAYSSIPVALGSTFAALLGKVFRPNCHLDTESLEATKVIANTTKPKVTSPPEAKFLAAFGPIREAHYVFPPPTGRTAPSFENGLRPLSEDLAPYIRAIMAYDLRLEQYRLQLSGLLSQNADGKKRVRKTRASRAALEGGSKAETRKERWFPSNANPSLILATGNKEWQDILLRNGHFTLTSTSAPSTECIDHASESSGDGGI